MKLGAGFPVVAHQPMETKSESGVTGRTRDAMARLLDHVLTEECSLSVKMREYRGNLTGPNFYSLHRLFEEQRRQLDYWLSRIFEQTTAAGFFSRSSVEAQAEKAQSTPPASESMRPQTIIGELQKRHEAMARQLRHDVERLGDPATAELLMRAL